LLRHNLGAYYISSLQHITTDYGPAFKAFIMSDVCSTCTEKFREESTMESLARASFVYWERKRSSLAESAGAGCPLCRILLAFDMKAEAAKPLRDGRRTAEQYLQHVRADSSSKVDFTFRLGSRRPSTLTVELGFGLFGAMSI
jgi:hypothetical protein